MYAGQKKVYRDIEKKVKAEKGRAKSNAKKADAKKALYYAKLLNQNKLKIKYECKIRALKQMANS